MSAMLDLAMMLPAPNGVEEFVHDTRLELVGVFVGATSGGLAAIRKQFDLFGVLVLAWVTGLGGGMLRDILLGVTPPAGIANPSFILTAFFAGVAVMLFQRRVVKNRRAVIVLDACALGVFVLIGTMKGLGLGAGVTASIVVGVLTGIGGGILRDILTGEPPLVLADGELYAIPALAGAGLTALLWHYGWLNSWTQWAVVIFIIAFRLLARRLGWAVPNARLAEAARSPWQAVDDTEDN
jgi:uncharacterized membrane protein YeiH